MGIPERFAALDTLRGVAALVVALGHFGTLRGVTYYLAVDFFLILSGFVLSHAYFWRPTMTLRRFLWLRWARMYPLHLLTLLFIVGVLAYRGETLPWREILLHLGFVQNMGLGPDRSVLNSPAWSISVEFWINAGVFALLILGGRRFDGVRVLMFLMVGMAALAVTAVFTGHLQADIADYKGVLNSGLVRCIGTFSIGVAGYYVYRQLWMGRAGSLLTFGLRSTSAQLLLVVLFLVALLFPRPGTVLDFLALPIFGLLILSLAWQELPVARWLGHGALLGDLSFPVYLVHFPVLVVIADPYRVPDGIPGVYQTSVFLTLVFGAAVLVHYFFEKPLYRRLKRIGA